MHLQLLKLILWPKNDDVQPRILSFTPGMVNVITGHSKTGKSAVIPIIDYCLGSKSCSIPVGVIRDKCAWFGIVIETFEGQKLLARREPETQQSTGDMFVAEGIELAVPHNISQKNSNDEAVRALLDRLAGLTQLEFDVDTDHGFKLRPSFRDMTAFVFQPQNIVANPGVLFYKADTTEHREKLKTVMPYALKAITPRVMALRQQSVMLTRKLRSLEKEAQTFREVSSRRISEGRTWITQAQELGLEVGQAQHDGWESIRKELAHIAQHELRSDTPAIKRIEGTLEALEALRRSERELASKASTNRQRLMELRRLQEGASEYEDGIRLQRDRLSLSHWMRTALEERHDAPLLFASETAHSLDQLCNALAAIETQLQGKPLAAANLDAELLRQRTEAEQAMSELSAVRQEIRIYEANSERARHEIERSKTVERFLGALQQALRHYEQADESDLLNQAIKELRENLAAIGAQIQERAIQARAESALDEIQNIASSIVPQLHVEWADSPIRLDPKELTVRVSRKGRHYYLWEIGSGANWVAYHVAITLALQHFFIKNRPSPVPSLLVYDQPSQVYFPKLTAEQISGRQAVKLTDQEDIQAVRRIFQAMATQALANKGSLQIIVLDHADEEVWGDLVGITKVADWRQEGLVPSHW